ncbi:MAG: hypothetical protein ACREBW_09120, partial [Candidatus Micrarchaeaceae archaeon]
VGLAASRGSGRYKGHGIGSRIKHVIAVDWDNKSESGKRVYKVREKWAEITHISSIGFSDKGYLAAALESYLLGRLNPDGMLNRNRPGAV